MLLLIEIALCLLQVSFNGYRKEASSSGVIAPPAPPVPTPMVHVSYISGQATSKLLYECKHAVRMFHAQIAVVNTSHTQMKPNTWLILCGSILHLPKK